MGQKAGEKLAAIPGSRIYRTKGADPLKTAVDQIVKIQDRANRIEKQKLLGEDGNEEFDESIREPFSIANISKSYIKKSGQMAEIKHDLQREKELLILKQTRKMQAANDVR